MRYQITLGVIGHVDHGKTSLVRALTGIDTDRLKEERERGLSIVLGFSYLSVPEGTIDLIDVPGHEDFVRTMISGATGIDGTLLVVAADEGVKPQTIEHFDIARLIGIDKGIIVITKSDTVPREKYAAVLNSLRPLIKGSYLERAPVVFTSAVTGDGLDLLCRRLGELVTAKTPWQEEGRFFLPLDRVFTMAGFGTIVTGTLRRGRLRADDPVEIMPVGIRATIRQLQVHGHPVEEGLPGERVAVNLRHIKAADIARGEALATPGLLRATRRIDGELTLLNRGDVVLCTGVRVRLLFGTVEVITRLRLLDRDKLRSGDKALVQFRCEADVAALAGEPFVARSYSPVRTIGGGRFLDVHPPRHRRFSVAVLRRLDILASVNLEAVLAEQIRSAGCSGATIRKLADDVGLPVDRVREALRSLPVILIDEHFAIDLSQFDALCRRTREQLDRFHTEQPTRLGMPLSALRAVLPERPSAPIFEHCLQTLVARSEVETDRGVVRRSGFDPMASLTVSERRLVVAIATRFKDGGATPPDVAAVVGDNEACLRLFYLLVQARILVPMAASKPHRAVVFHREALEAIRQQLTKAFPPPKTFTVSDTRVLLKSTRKYVVPLLEFLDAERVTKRDGDVRRLSVRCSSSP